MTKLAESELRVLREFKAANGRTWKSRLADVWSRGNEHWYPYDIELRQIRNTLGPRGLFKLKLDA